MYRKYNVACVLRTWPPWLQCSSLLNISQLERVMLMLRVKCSEQWLYLAVFVTVFLHLLPSWDLSPHWWWLTQNVFLSSLLLCAPPTYRLHRLRWMPSSGYLTHWTLLCAYVLLCSLSVLLLVLFSPLFSLLTPRTSPHPPSFPFPALSSHFFFTPLHQKLNCLTDWLNECLTDSLTVN